MTQRELDIDLLKSLSIIEGALVGSGNTTLRDVAIDEMEWIIDLLVARLKEKE